MKKLFLFLLRNYSNTEIERIEIRKILDQKIEQSYPGQTKFGDVYNSHIEFIIGNEFINKLVRDNDTDALEMIKEGLNDSFSKGIQFIRIEKK